jgi:bile acid:Na+ symporter, BASS family
MVGPLEQAILALMIFVIMLGMGATIHRVDLRVAFASPKAFLIGMACQFGLMPLIAFALAVAFQLPPAVALALIMVGATPGGTTSNLFSYYAKGDVALSVAMTVASTTAAVVMMPLCIALYAGGELTGDIEIPYSNIAVTVALVLIPFLIGYWVRQRNVVWAAWLEWIGGVMGMVVIAALILNFFIENTALVLATPMGEIAATILLSVCGFVAGYLVSRALGLTLPHARTVALETGIQNAPLTVGVIVLSFASGPMQDTMVLAVALYAVFVVITSTLTALWFRWQPVALKPA